MTASNQSIAKPFIFTKVNKYDLYNISVVLYSLLHHYINISNLISQEITSIKSQIELKMT